MKVVQLDSIPIVARTQYLVLYSRLGEYPAGLLDRMAYHHREWLETWGHEASLVSMELEPWFRWRHERARKGETWKNLVHFARTHRGYVADVLAEVRERGALGVGELSDPRPRGGDWWGARSAGSLALDWLFRIGEVGVHRTPSFDKRFDLYERLVPAEHRDRPTPSVEEAHRRLLELSAEALGVATANDLADYFRLKMRDARPRIEELVESGLLETVDVEGWDRVGYVHADARVPRSIDRVTFLSPFDPVVWKRDRVARLFGFEYRIEIYVPAAKRRWGYYVLPFLMGESMVGRVDLKSDRKQGVLRVLGAWLEEGTEAGVVADRLYTELRHLARWLGLGCVELGRRGDLMPGLRSRQKVNS